jgi:tetratricopeptide (TPR) repeat protein
MNKAISLKPEQAMFYYVRGLKIYSPMNREREALKDYDMAIRLGLNKPRVYTERAHSKYVLGDYKGASSDVALALSRDPKDIDALTIRGRLELKSGKYSAAIEALTKAIDIGPSSRVITPDIKRAMADMHSVRAECYQKVRETEKAEADFSKAKELLLEAKKSEERTGEPGK